MATRNQKRSGLLRVGLTTALLSGLGLVLLPSSVFSAFVQPVSTYAGHKNVYDNCIDICPDYVSEYKIKDDCSKCHKGLSYADIMEMVGEFSACSK